MIPPHLNLWGFKYMSLLSPLLSLPSELRLYIIYKACTYTEEDLQTLYSLTLTSRDFYVFISSHRTFIVEHYTEIVKNVDCTRWLLCGQKHRDNDLPAVIWSHGTQYWYRHGQKHRDNGLPAVIWASGSQHWYQHGQLHRDNDLPAVIYDGGTVEYWVNGARTD